MDVRTISAHIKKVFLDSELEKSATIRNFRIVQTEGSRQVSHETNHYNLQIIGKSYTDKITAEIAKGKTECKFEKY